MPLDPQTQVEIDEQLASGQLPDDVFRTLQQKGKPVSFDDVLEREYSRIQQEEQAQQNKGGNIPGVVAGLGLSAAANFPAFKSGGMLSRTMAGLDTILAAQDNTGRPGVITPSNVASAIGIGGNVLGKSVGPLTKDRPNASLIQTLLSGGEGAATGGLSTLADERQPEVSPVGGMIGGALGALSGFKRGTLSRAGNASGTAKLERAREMLTGVAGQQDMPAWDRQGADVLEGLQLNAEANKALGEFESIGYKTPNPRQSPSDMLPDDYPTRYTEFVRRTGLNPLKFTADDLSVMKEASGKNAGKHFAELLDNALRPSARNYGGLNEAAINQSVEQLGAFIRMMEQYQGANAKKNLSGAAAAYFLRKFMSPDAHQGLLSDRLGETVTGLGGGPTVETHPAARKLIEDIFMGQPKVYETLRETAGAIRSIRALKSPNVAAGTSSNGSVWMRFGNTVTMLTPSSLAEGILQGKAPLLFDMHERAARYTRELMKNPTAKGNNMRVMEREIARLAALLGARTIRRKEKGEE